MIDCETFSRRSGLRPPIIVVIVGYCWLLLSLFCVLFVLFCVLLVLFRHGHWFCIVFCIVNNIVNHLTIDTFKIEVL